ncbi:MAG: winged helix-turn-helix transcriptional regulator [Flavobacteriales bacterium]|nr:winged helix-turn-helix transcriptional regulator [Flavobacteriales bacterium]
MKSEKIAHPLLDGINPNECVSSQLNRVSRVINKIFRSHLKPMNITLSQLGIMFLLGKKKNIYQSEVAAFLKLDPSTLTRDLERLIKKGFVQKSGYANKPNLDLTEGGFVHLEKTIPYWKKAQEEVAEVFDGEGISSVNYLFAKI